MLSMPQPTQNFTPIRVRPAWILRRWRHLAAFRLSRISPFIVKLLRRPKKKRGDFGLPIGEVAW
jgi:hypothetical protein